HQLENRGNERVDERVLERPQKDRVVQVHPEVVQANEVARPADHLVADRQPDAEDERIGDEERQDDERGREQDARKDVLALQEMTHALGTAELGDRHHDDGHRDRRGALRRALGQDGLDALISHRCLSREPVYAYAFFSSASAHFAASSGFIPLIACAYMSTRMYFTSASLALRLGCPG